MTDASEHEGLLDRLVNGPFEKLLLVGSMTPWAGAKAWIPWMILFFLGPAGAAVALLFLPPLVSVPLAIAVAALVVGPVLGWRAVWRRRLAWRDALPFELANYPEIYAWDAKRYMTLLVAFEREPDRKLLADVLHGGLFKTKIDAPDGGAHRIWVENPDASFGALSRPWLDVWVRDTVDRLLRPLHDEYGIRRLTLGE